MSLGESQQGESAGQDGALFGAILQAADEAFVLADDTGRITGWNPAAERTFGWTREEAVGRTLAATIIPPALRAAHSAGMERFVATGEAHVLGKRLELSALHKDGHEFPIEMTISAVRGDDDAYRFAALLHDISERRAAEADLRRLAAIVAAAGEGIAALRTDGTVASWNPGAEAILGRSRASVVGRPLADLFARGADSHAHDLVRRALAGDTVRTDIELRRADETTVLVALSLSALPPGPDGEPGVAAVFRDITDRKVAEERLAAFARRQRELAKRDDLTGLHNERAVHEGLDVALTRGLGVAVVRFELNGLRAVVARRGGPAGEDILRSFARLLESVAPTSWAGRLGGADFVLVLPGAERLDARRAGTALAEELAALNTGTEALFGVAAVSGGARSAEALLAAAEKDLLTRSDRLVSQA